MIYDKQVSAFTLFCFCLFCFFWCCTCLQQIIQSLATCHLQHLLVCSPQEIAVHVCVMVVVVMGSLLKSSFCPEYRHIIFHGELQLYKYQERLETENEEKLSVCERCSLFCITLRLWRVGLGKKQFIAGSSLTHKELPISWWPLPGAWEGDFMGWQSLWWWHRWRGAVSEVKVAEGWRWAELSYGDLTAEWRAEQRKRAFKLWYCRYCRVDLSRLWLDQDNKWVELTGRMEAICDWWICRTVFLTEFHFTSFVCIYICVSVAFAAVWHVHKYDNMQFAKT